MRDVAPSRACSRPPRQQHLRVRDVAILAVLGAAVGVVLLALRVHGGDASIGQGSLGATQQDSAARGTKSVVSPHQASPATPHRRRQHDEPRRPILVLLPWGGPPSSWTGVGDVNATRLAASGVALLNTTEATATIDCVFAPRFPPDKHALNAALVNASDAIVVDSIAKMRADVVQLGSDVLGSLIGGTSAVDAPLSAGRRQTLVFWNTENWRGRMWEWSAKYNVRWLNLTNTSAFWAAMDVVLSFESTSDVVYRYAAEFPRLEAQLSELRVAVFEMRRRQRERRLNATVGETSIPFPFADASSLGAEATFVASNCFNRYVDEFDVTFANETPHFVRDVVGIGREMGGGSARVPRDRESVVRALEAEGIVVNSYGHCLRNRHHLHAQCTTPVFRRVAKLCSAAASGLFYLSFENSIFPDYVTEKLYEPLAAGVIPVYLGAPNVALFAPAAHSIIRAADFNSIAALAEYLKCVARNETVRDHYLGWRTRPLLPLFADATTGQPPLARLCAAIHAARSSPTSSTTAASGRAPRRPMAAVDPDIDALQAPLECT